MFKYLSIILLLFASSSLVAQVDTATVIFNWKDTSLVPSTIYSNTYNEVWGFVANKSEFAVIGSTAGTHIFNITTTGEESEVAFIPGGLQGANVVHRDFHDYNGYLYAVCGEDRDKSSLQIIDISKLPDSYEVVYDSNELFGKTHNIFIDNGNLYVCKGISSNADSITIFPMRVYSLKNPVAPELLYEYDGRNVHDLFVKDDITFLNNGGGGLFVLDFSDPTNPQNLTSLIEYPFKGYNQSGCLNAEETHYFFTDENFGLPLKSVDIRDPENIHVVATFGPETDSLAIAHNVLFRDDYLFASYYYDGLQVFDVSDPENPEKACVYSTSQKPHRPYYEGAWGVYPYLPSGKILVSDMQEGLFVLETNLNLNTFDVGIDTPQIRNTKAYPTLFTDKITLEHLPFGIHDILQINIYDLTGKLIHFQERHHSNPLKITLPNLNFKAGLYLLNVSNEFESINFKIVKGG